MKESRTSSSWQKSSHSGEQDCVEWRVVDGNVEVRNSKEHAGSVLSFSMSEWSAFLVAVKAGDADV